MTDAAGSPGSLVPLAGLLIAMAGLIVAFVGVRAVAGARERIIRERLRLILAPAAAVVDELALDQSRGAPRRGLRGRVFAVWHQWSTRAGGAAGLRPIALWALAIGAVVWSVAVFVFRFDVLSASLVAGAAGVFTANWKLGEVEIKRTERFLDHLPEAIDLVVRAAQAGIPMTEALALAGREVEPPLGDTFRFVAERIQLGVDVKDSLQEAAERVNIVDFDCFVVSLLVQRETGGQLAETLTNLSTLIRRRKETREKARALTAEGRLTAKVIGLLPVGIGGFLTVSSPQYISVLFDDPTGRLALMIATGCVLAGLLVIARLTRSEL